MLNFNKIQSNINLFLRILLLFCVSVYIVGCNKSDPSNDASVNQAEKIVLAKNGLPSVKSLISKSELNTVVKKKSLSKENAVKLISVLSGYNENLIGISLDLINDNNDVDFERFGTTSKILSTKISGIEYSSVVKAAAASLLLNEHAILAIGDTRLGYIIKANIASNLYANGGIIYIWIEPKDGEIYIYGKSELKQIYDVFGVNNKGLINIFKEINQILDIHQSFDEATLSNTTQN